MQSVIPQSSTITRQAYLTKALRYCRKEYNRLREDNQFCHHCSFDATEAMELTEKRFPDLGTFGVEGSCFKDSYTSGLSYLNSGDTYEVTILFRSDRERFWVGSWGDFVERHPKLFD